MATKTYSTSEEKFLRSVTLYAHTDNKLYYDKAHTQKVNKADLMNICAKGLLTVMKDNTFCAPVAFKENSGEVEVTVITAVTGGTVTAITVKSDSHV